MPAHVSMSECLHVPLPLGGHAIRYRHTQAQVLSDAAVDNKASGNREMSPGLMAMDEQLLRHAEASGC